MKVALVYDRVNTPYGGAEKVLVAIHTVFPDAPLYTSVYDQEKAKWAKKFKVIPSILQKIPFANRMHRWLAPLMPLAFEAFNLDEYDVVISITSAEAKGVLTKPHQLHICYLLTPTRYLYSHRQGYEVSLPKLPLLNDLTEVLLDYLTWWDQSACFRPDVYVPISELVGQRCRQYYHQKPAEVLYPPVEPVAAHQAELPKALASLANEDFYLVVSRLVDYKRIDLAIRACQQLGRKLVIVGEGPAKSNLQELASQNAASDLAHFLGSVDQSTLAALYQHAKGLLMPGIEDYGITALEAVASGVPAILHQSSGAAELLTDGQDGVFLTELTVTELKRAILHLEQLPSRPDQLKKKLAKYATTMFCERFEAVVSAQWRLHQKEHDYERT